MRCGVEKELETGFYAVATSRDGYGGQCRVCLGEIDKMRGTPAFDEYKREQKEKRLAEKAALKERTTKACNRCNLEQPIGNFDIQCTNRDGLRHQCKKCCEEIKLARVGPLREKQRIETERKRAARRAEMRAKPTKVCKVCAVEKPREDYYDNEELIDGKCSWCKACESEKSRIYAEENPDIVAARGKRWADANPEKLKEYRHRHRVSTAIARDAWKKANPEKIRVYQRKYTKEKRRTDNQYKLAMNIRSRLRSAIKGNKKWASTEKLLGCSWAEFEAYYGALFTEGMTWEKVRNGEVHMDHIVPCCLFDLEKKEEQFKCFHYTNLRPMWPVDNKRKGQIDKRMKKERDAARRKQQAETENRAA